MTELFIQILLHAAFIIGLNRSFYYTEIDGIVYDKMLFWRVHRAAAKHLSPFWLKPLFACSICMASVYSPLYWIVQPFTMVNLFQYILYIPALAGTIAILDRE